MSDELIKLPGVALRTIGGDEESDRKDMVSLGKAMFIAEEGGQNSRAIAETEELSTAFSQAGTLIPPYDPGVLTLIYEQSSSLRPNIDAYVTNIDSYGHTFAPVIDLDSPDAEDKIKNALRMERKSMVRTGKAAADVVTLAKATSEPSDKEVEARKKELRIEMREEAARLSIFFESCTVGLPFSGPEGLRGLTRQDLEVTGNAYWEVLRNGVGEGEVVAFNRLPSVSVRLKSIDAAVVDAQIRRRSSLLSFDQVPVRNRYRRFVQKYEGQKEIVYFKEFGDPRTVSSRTGKAYESLSVMQGAEGEDGAEPATEVIHFKITSPRTIYGVPRWIGVLLAVLGSRQAEEVNFLYFENKSIPPLAILVSGGRLSTESAKRVEDWISNNIRGKRNFHKVLILEAESANAAQPGEPDSGKMRIVLQPLTAAQQKDGLFLDYDQANADKVGQSFRLPRLLRGDVRDFNRSTAEASVDFAEIQVFGPIRQQFDWLMNQLILPAIDVRYHEFVSNAPTVRDPVNLSLMIKDLVTASVLTPGEGRDLAKGVFNRDFLKIDAAWTNMPIALTIAGRNMQDDLHTPGVDEATRYGSGGAPGVAAGPMSTPGAGAAQAALGVNKGVNKSSAEVARILIKLHDHMLAGERAEFEAQEREVVKVPSDIFYGWFQGDGAAK